MPDVPGTVNFPTSLDSTVSLIEAANNAATTLSSSVSSSDTTLTVVSTADFASSGVISIEGEVIFYTGKTSTTFTGCVRGADGTVADTHDSDVAVQGLIVAAHHNTLAEAVIATQTKLGSGSGAPGSGQVLQGNGSGTSEWAALPNATTSDSGLMSAADKIQLDGKLDKTGGTVTGQTGFSYTGSTTNDSTQAAILIKPGGAPNTNYQPLRIEPDGSTTPVLSVDVDGNITLAQSLIFKNSNIVLYSHEMRWLRFRGGRQYGLVLNPTSPLGFSSSSAIPTNIADTALCREGAGIFAQKSGTTSQAYRLYNTTDGQADLTGTNYERLSIGFETNEIKIASEAAGTGAARDFNIAGGDVGIGSTPEHKLHVDGRVYSTADFVSDAADKGVVLKSPNGHYWRLTVDDTGSLATTDLGTSLPA